MAQTPQPSPRKRGPLSRLDVGVTLISATVVIAAVGIVAAVNISTDLATRLLIMAIFAVLIGVLWVIAVRNSRIEATMRRQLQAEHPGSLVERVRIWALPHRQLERDTPVHFLIADAGEVSFETIDRTVLLRIPVSEIGLIDLVVAHRDRARDQAVTIIYGADEDVVQFFTVTYSGNEKLRERLLAAIAWDADRTP